MEFDTSTDGLQFNTFLIKGQCYDRPAAMKTKTLIVVLRMCIKHDLTSCPIRFGVEHKLLSVMSSIMSDNDTADISFLVKGRIFHAHLCILKAIAPDFVETLNLEEKDKNSKPVPINDVDPEIFEKVLAYMYGVDLSIMNSQEGRQMIDAAEKYEIEHLKLAAETRYVAMIKEFQELQLTI
jgi:hypothetical protein